MNKQIIAFTLAAISLFGLTSFVMKSEVDTRVSDFAQWKVTFNRAYASDAEEIARFAIYQSNDKLIKEHNAQNDGVTLKHNQFSDMTKEEWKQSSFGYVKRSGPQETKKFEKLEDAPASLDWRTKGAVTAVKDQGQCGSCWAFSTVGGTEGAYFVAGNTLTSFSEQQINSCDKVDLGCNGGDLPSAFKYVTQNGLETEESYPYTSGGGKTGKCKEETSEVLIKKGELKHTMVETDNQDAMTTAIQDQPLSICIEADSDVFQFYSNGVITSKQCGTQLDHCVTLVGYNDETNASTPYWIVKNSWAKSWGNEGYVWIEKGGSNKKGVCGIAEEPAFATITKA